MSLLEALFWVSTAVLAYTYFGYPLLLTLWRRARSRSSIRGSELPTVSVVVVAHNEAECIRQKIDNVLSLDYPPERLELIVASDGSTDATVARARSRRSRRVRVLAFLERRGKSAVLNDVVPAVSNEIVVLVDARQRVERRALMALVGHFSDPAVGGVGGDLILVDSHARGAQLARGIGAYWSYEKAIRRLESDIDSTIGTTGALYAIRRHLFEPIPDDTILDDVLIPMQVTRRGYRMLLEPRARAYDQLSSTVDTEFRRKVRTIAGNFQLFARAPWLLSPGENRLWLQTLSHKFLRLMAPPALVAAFFSSALLMHEPFYAVAFALQSIFYAAAFGGHRMRLRPRKHPVLNVPYAFCVLTWATVVGFARWVTGRQGVMWQTHNAR